MNRFNRPKSALGSILCAAMLSTAPSFAATTVDETRALQAAGRVQVENTVGKIEIIAWEKSEIRIQAELSDDVEELEINETSAGIKIRVRNQKNKRSVDGSDLVLHVPVSAVLDTQSVSADIHVEGLNTSGLMLDSVSGDITVRADTQRLEAESVSGDIRFEGRVARVAVETVSGEIELRGVSGEVAVSTVSGDVELSGQNLTRGRFETVSGNLEIQAGVKEQGRLTAESMSGDVRLLLPASQQAEFDVQTYSGSIRTDFDTRPGNGSGPGSSWTHVEGNDSSSIQVECFSGDVKISRE